MNRMNHPLIAVALLGICLEATSVCARGDEPPHVKAARARQAAVKTFSVTLKRTEVTAKGFASGIDGGLYTKKTIPPEETTTESVNYLVIDGEKFRYEDNHPLWNLSDGTLHNPHEVVRFNGELVKMHWPKGMGGTAPSSKDVPQGKIDSSSIFSGIRGNELVPIVETFRGLDPSFCAYIIDHFKPTGTSVLIDDVPCEPFSLKESPEFIVYYYFDPASDYVIRRVRKERNGELDQQCDIQYAANNVCGWLPVSWEDNLFSADGRLLRSCKIEVADAKLNEPQPSDQFDVVFPEGTFVFDQRDYKFYKVLEDGDMRETSPNGQLLPGAAAVPQPGASWFRRHRWLVIATSVAVGAAMVLLVYAIRKKNRVVS